LGLSHDDVQEILRLLEASDFDELVLETGGMKLVLRRNGAAGEAKPVAAPRPAQAAEAKAAPVESANGRAVPAPMLGTFYRAPKPGAPPFIEVGALVEPDTVVGIIEVMKLMNAVTAGVRGRVTEICADDGALVEYGQSLIRVEAAA
jgi:acetyl-CoA carboxylase biotin carboxyl carrier protein